ncbi:hypothetical protein P8452_63996 [Trifolium repens]|nr:hypothetical protein P8452_63996 [Trifolium repens]
MLGSRYYNPKLQNPKLPYFPRLQECEYDDDCPQIGSSPLVMRCIDYNSKYKFGRIPRVFPRIRECEHDDDCPQIVSSMVMSCLLPTADTNEIERDGVAE